MAITIEQLCDIINNNFGEPFLVKGGVVAELIEDQAGNQTLSINIGRRDVQINANGEVLGAGTFVGMPGDTLVNNFSN